MITNGKLKSTLDISRSCIKLSKKSEFNVTSRLAKKLEVSDCKQDWKGRYKQYDIFLLRYMLTFVTVVTITRLIAKRAIIRPKMIDDLIIQLQSVRYRDIM